MSWYPVSIVFHDFSLHYLAMKSYVNHVYYALAERTHAPELEDRVTN